MTTILLLLHEKDGYPKLKGYAIWSHVDLWTEWGLRVEVSKGVDHPADADLVFPHIDQTIVPPHYREFLDRQPRVVNRGVYDVSKRRISSLLVERGDGYDGPVIVKTNFNSGGLAESFPPSGRRTPLGRLRQKALKRIRFRGETDLATATAIPPSKYPLYESVWDVPDEVFENESLIVERFLAEREGDLYIAWAYHFLGDHHICRRLGSRWPVVKEKASVINEEVPPHEEIVAIRRNLGLDYGKLDYVLSDDRVVLLDVNPTPGLIFWDAGLATARARRLAPGIRSFLNEH